MATINHQWVLLTNKSGNLHKRDGTVYWWYSENFENLMMDGCLTQPWKPWPIYIYICDKKC